MLRAIILCSLLTSPAALACGGKPCGSSCSMAAHASTTAVDDVDAAEGTKAKLMVTGMTCGACAAKVTAALKGVEGVTAASVDHETGDTRIAFDATKTDIDALIAVVEKLGKYKAAKADPEA